MILHALQIATSPEMTQDQFDKGEHYELSKENAKDNGYIEPMITFVQSCEYPNPYQQESHGASAARDLGIILRAVSTIYGSHVRGTYPVQTVNQYHVRLKSWINRRRAKESVCGAARAMSPV